MKRAGIIFTGGTISMLMDQRKKAVIPGYPSYEIMSCLTNISEIADVESLEIGPYPGPHITPDIMFEIVCMARRMLQRNDLDGVVITHGTDTIEETALLLDLLIESEKPVVLTGSMRNSSELGFDGPANLAAAICAAVAVNSRNKGVLVVMNNEVNAASEVTKTHTMKLDTFKSLDYGPLGIVDNNQVIYYRNKPHGLHFEIDRIVTDVYLIKTVAGMDDKLIRFCVDCGSRGIVIEAMGRGNIPPDMMNGVRYAIDNNVSVVLVSRCPAGRVLDSYGYLGGGRELRKMGVIFCSDLSGVKARIKLMVALGATNDINEIRKLFEDSV